MPTSAAEILRRLEAAYGTAHPHLPRPPLETLVACILSQHTSDANSHRAFERLRERFPTWADVATAPEQSIEAAIRVGGLGRSKARTLKRVLAAIHASEGHYSLNRLSSLPTDEAREFLLRLPGVGPKTAAIVLCFSMGRPVLPVDTHVHRVSKRLGLIGPRVGAERAHEELADRVPPELVYRFHVALIRHGRRTCRARRPLCAQCPLRDLCPS